MSDVVDKKVLPSESDDLNNLYWDILSNGSIENKDPIGDFIKELNKLIDELQMQRDPDSHLKIRNRLLESDFNTEDYEKVIKNMSIGDSLFQTMRASTFGDLKRTSDINLESKFTIIKSLLDKKQLGQL